MRFLLISLSLLALISSLSANEDEALGNSNTPSLAGKLFLKRQKGRRRNDCPTSVARTITHTRNASGGGVSEEREGRGDLYWEQLSFGSSSEDERSGGEIE